MNNKAPFLDRAARVFSKILSFLFVSKCVICGDTSWDDGEMCPECRKMWESARLSRCPVCGKTARGCTCRPILLTSAKRLGDRYLSALTFYGKPDSEDKRDILVRRAVNQIKKSPDRRIIRFAARELSQEILRYLVKAGEKPESWFICYPPRTKKRVRQFGFDQGRELAREISRYTGISHVNLFSRTGNELQKTLRLPDRKRCAERSLALRKGADTARRKYIIVDDIITTGATVNSCASLLMKNGASAVFPVCVSRTKARKRKVRRKPSDRPWFSR